MATLAELVGSYVGTPRLRPGAENSLKPAEIKALLREASPAPLEIRADGTFRHRGALDGTVTIDDATVHCTPLSFDGMTHEAMRRRAEDSGREFGLGWLFTPFALTVEADGAMATVSESVVQVLYTRKEPKSSKKSGS